MHKVIISNSREVLKITFYLRLVTLFKNRQKAQLSHCARINYSWITYNNQYARNKPLLANSRLIIISYLGSSLSVRIRHSDSFQRFLYTPYDLLILEARITTVYHIRVKASSGPAKQGQDRWDFRSFGVDGHTSEITRRLLLTPTGT